MPIEKDITTVKEFNPVWPLNSDNLAQGAEHLRLLKSTLINQFGSWGTMEQDHNFFYTLSQVYNKTTTISDSSDHDRVYLGRNSVNFTLNLLDGLEITGTITTSNNTLHRFTVGEYIQTPFNVIAYSTNIPSDFDPYQPDSSINNIRDFRQEGVIKMEDFLREYFDTIDKIADYRDELRGIINKIEEV